MAINKERIIKIINGRAIPAVQPLPPGMPGFDKDYKGYAYDVDKAKALMKEAGYGDGVDTELYVYNTDPNPRIAQAIQQDLAAIGIRAAIKSLDQANVIAAGGTEKTAPMIWSGGMAWIADFPDPVRLLRADPRLRRRRPRAAGTGRGTATRTARRRPPRPTPWSSPRSRQARAELWRSIFIKIMDDDAPWAPVFHEEHYTIHSARIGGDGRGVQRSRSISRSTSTRIYATDVQ